MTEQTELHVLDDYSDMVAALAKPGQIIVDEMDKEKAHMLHMAVGIAGESLELFQAFAEAVSPLKSLDMENAVEELGDIEFYIEGYYQALRMVNYPEQLPEPTFHVDPIAGVMMCASDILDLTKKHVIYGKELDHMAIKGRLEFIQINMAAVMISIGISREEVLRANMDKLGERYHGGSYSDQHAHERADKKDHE